jgi:hypothetical protein
LLIGWENAAPVPISRPPLERFVRQYFGSRFAIGNRYAGAIERTISAVTGPAPDAYENVARQLRLQSALFNARFVISLSLL